MIAPTTGAVGGVGAALTVNVVGDETQLLSIVLLTRIGCEPGDTPANVTED